MDTLPASRNFEPFISKTKVASKSAMNFFTLNTCITHSFQFLVNALLSALYRP